MPDDFDARDDHGGWEDEDMPEEDDRRQPEPPWPAAGQPSYRDAPPRRWPARRGVALVLTAVIAAVAGFLAVIAVRDLSARPAAANSVAPAGGPAPSAGVPAPSAVPPPGRGRVSGIGGVKTGDLVSLQVTGTDGKLTATATQDPASLP
jgi:hypothetical protein